MPRLPSMIGRTELTVVFVAAQISAALAAPAMWEVSDANSSIWLFGSIHGLPKDATAWRTPLLDKTIDDAAKIYFETDIGPAGMAALTVKSIVAGFSAAQQPSWVATLTTEQATRLSSALSGLQITLEQADKMSPWLVAMQLSQAEAQQSDAKLDFTKGVDFVLEWELPAERKAFFETPGEQFDLLAAGSTSDQVAQVLSALDELDGRQGGEMATLVTAWQAGDLAALEATVTSEAATDPAFLQKLLYQRNRNWLPKIEQMLADDARNLVIVGTAHLAGTGSVIDLLEQAGYTVRRIQ